LNAAERRADGSPLGWAGSATGNSFDWSIKRIDHLRLTEVESPS
jgi:hypothetical protein